MRLESSSVREGIMCKRESCAKENDMPLMNKTLSKEIMKRTKLPNKYLRERTDESKKQCTSQQNCCVSLLEKTKRDYHNTLNEKYVSANKTFWKTMKPFFSDKIVSKEHFLLVENDEIVSEESEDTESFNSFFFKKPNIPVYKPHNDSLFENVFSTILKVILKSRNHLSILTKGEVWKKK